MGVSFDLPTPLEIGDCITVIGQVGKSHFSMELVSQFMAFDPDRFLESDNADIANVPASKTIPLLIKVNTTGEWEVIGETPETSSNASGYNAVRNGFRQNETFCCKIYVQKDNFEVRLNGACLSLSDHMIPVSCIETILIEGDCSIDKLLFGDTQAVESSVQKTSITRRPQDNVARHNLSAVVIECRVKSKLFDSLESLDDTGPSKISNLDEKENNQVEDSTIDVPKLPNGLPGKRYSVSDLPSIHRTGSYQLVFDVNGSDDEEPMNEWKDKTTDCFYPINRAVSCTNLGPYRNVEKDSSRPLKVKYNKSPRRTEVTSTLPISEVNKIQEVSNPTKDSTQPVIRQKLISRLPVREKPYPRSTIFSDLPHSTTAIYNQNTPVSSDGNRDILSMRSAQHARPTSFYSGMFNAQPTGRLSAKELSFLEEAQSTSICKMSQKGMKQCPSLLAKTNKGSLDTNALIGGLLPNKNTTNQLTGCLSSQTNGGEIRSSNGCNLVQRPRLAASEAKVKMNVLLASQNPPVRRNSTSAKVQHPGVIGDANKYSSQRSSDITT